jgi:hypothetical protein
MHRSAGNGTFDIDCTGRPKFDARNGSLLRHSSNGFPMNSPMFDPATEKYVSRATYRRNGIEVKTPV